MNTLHPVIAKALAPYAPPPRFSVTYCSQCGEEFGPGDSGFSHCSDHMEEGACSNCSGSGEGMWDGSTCTVCKGTGSQMYAVEPDDTDDELEAA